MWRTKLGRRRIGDGPYRSAPAPISRETRQKRWVYGVVAAVLLGPLLLVLFGGNERDPLESAVMEELPPVLIGHVAVFPPVDPELGPATPLDPLLAADGPERLTLRQPSPGATRLNRNDPLQIAFNRPMVEGAQVGRAVDDPPITLRTPGGRIGGTARWTSRSRLVFHAEASAWRGVREATLVVDPALRALDGDALGEQLERVVVFDGTPHLLASGGQRVGAGSPLPLFFDNAVNAAEVAQDVLAYEIGGGARTMPFQVVARGWDEARYRLDVVPARTLEPGAQIGVALAPRWTRWAGATPAVARYTIQPRPHIEGVGCAEDAARSGRCDHGAVPGRVVDIGPALRVLATEPLRPSALRGIRIRPALPHMQVAFAPGAPRVVSITGEWAADQVYEVRFPTLHTTSGERLDALGPLAVRSRGHAPTVQMVTGRQAFERDDPGVLHLRGIATGKGALFRREVPCCEAESDAAALEAALDPRAYVDALPAAHTPLLSLLPEARANRWGDGKLAWAKGSEGPRMAVVGVRAGEHGATSTQALFAQRTNLGTTVRVTREGVLAWVSRLHDATPVRGARVVLADEDGAPIDTATTDPTGAAWIPTPTDRTALRSALLSAHAGDRSVVVLERGRVVGPAAMGMPVDGVVDESELPRAHVFTDRGAYRPGSELHVRAQVWTADDARAPIPSMPVVVRVQSPGASRPDLETELVSNGFGSVSASFTLPASIGLGRREVVLVRPRTPSERDDEDADSPPEARLASASIQVADFRDPAFRVDLDLPERVVAGDPLQGTASATYLFGAPLSGAEMSHSLIRESAAPHASRWRELTFAPAAHFVTRGTLASGSARLDAGGRAPLDLGASLEATVRQRVVLETEVRDRSGQTTAAHHTFVVHPAAYEVGLRRGPDWTSHCDPGDAECAGLRAELIVVDPTDRPVEGRAVEVTFHREGWHDWWQWARGGDRYQARQQHRRELVHRCALTSAGEAYASCAHRPERPGTYVIEAVVVDEVGRRAIASRRVYVAGPDEAPDRDPPGAPIAVTPSRPQYRVGETAELAVESPWPEAEVLVAVEQGGVIHRSRERIGSGGHVVRVPVTEAMVPNAFVSVALLRPRLGPPGERMDLMGPDLRFGMASLRARPEEAVLDVAVEAPPEARPGETVTVRVHAAPDAEVALWAVDEGILRLTDWETPRPSEALFTPEGAAFAWEDLRRTLASRVAPPEHRAGGDGGGSAERTLRPREPVSIATPLWAPQLQTDANGDATATVTLPERDTEYRVIAVAMDARGASGSATSAIVAKRDVVAREALPRFVTERDAFEAAFYVTNTDDEPHSVHLSFTVGDDTETERVHLRAGEERRVARTVDAPSRAETQSLAIHLEARTRVGTQRVGRELPIAPAARWTRRHAMGSVASGESPRIGLRFPEDAVGSARLVVAAHPFLGARLLDEGLGDWRGLEHRAAHVLTLASQLQLQEGVDLDLEVDELRARGRRAVDALLGHQNAFGAFGRYEADGWAAPIEGTLAVHALVIADRAGLEVSPSALARGLEWLEDVTRRSAFGAALGVEASDAEAYALHVLRQGDVGVAELVDTVYERRDGLGYAGRAHLALAMDDDDDRRETLVLEAAELARAEERDPSLPYAVSRPPNGSWETGALVEAASRTSVGHRHASALASELLRACDAASAPCAPRGHQAPLDRVASARALVAYADLFRRTTTATATPTLDGQALAGAAPEGESTGLARYDLDVARLARASQLGFQGGGAGPTFYVLEAEWSTPLGTEDRIARGRRAALHRRFERADGRAIQSGESVPLGETIRVRLFVHTEESAPELVQLVDPLGAGFEAVGEHFASNPSLALRTLLGMGPDDEVMDPRGRHAARTATSISQRALEPNAAYFTFDALPMGLQEITYAVRATTPGRFTLAPAQIDSARDDGFRARSSLMELRVLDPADGEP